jgi:glycolate oxidase iron-sulfur subunit
MVSTRAALHDLANERRAPRAGTVRRVAEWLGYRVVLPRHWLLVALTWVLLAGQRLRLVPRRFALPTLRARSLTRLDLPVAPTEPPDAWVFTGCVMDAWQRDTHRSAAAVLRALGVRAARPGSGGDCCGALHAHAGRDAEARRLAARVLRSMPGEAAVVVDSAGCGAVMREYGLLLGTTEAAAFAARVVDFSTFVAANGAPAVLATGRQVVVQDPCHLRHVQGAHGAVREVLRGAYSLVDTDDDGLCCGAGGAYAAVQPDLARAVRDRKVAALRRAGGPDPLVASANPGCVQHLRAAGVDARHPADLLAAALDHGPRRPGGRPA